MDMVLDLIERELFFIGNRLGRNCIIFGVDVSSSVRVDNKKKKDALILGEGLTQGLDSTKLAADKKDSKTLVKRIRNFV